MNLFDIIPENFFNYLASGSNNRIHADCLELAYLEYNQEISYRIPRDRIRDVLASYLLENQMEYHAEEGEESLRSAKDIATGILRHFTAPEVGWMEEDNDDETYERHVIMTEQGILLAEMMLALKRPEREEYVGYIFAIKNTLASEEQWRMDPYVNVLKDVYRNARLLSKSLKKLSTFIKKIIQQMVEEETLESLTENLLAYCQGDFIREYSRLTKQQNIRIYRSFIQERLDFFRDDPVALRQLAEHCAAEERCSVMTGEEQVLDMIQATRQFLSEDYDQIMRDIRHKINLYLTIAVGRARFLRTKSQDVRGNVEETIRILAGSMEEVGWKGELPAYMHSMFPFERHEFIDRESLRYPTRKRSIDTQMEADYQEMTEEDIRRAIEEQRREAYNPFSKELAAEFLERQMGSRRQLEGAELPLESKEDLLMSMAAVTYGEENGYQIRVEDGYFQSGKMVMRNFTVKRRENRRDSNRKASDRRDRKWRGEER